MIPVGARTPRISTIEGARAARARRRDRQAATRAWLPFLALYATPLLLVALALTVRAAGSNVLVGDVAVARTVQGLSLPGAADFARAGYWIGATPVTMGWRCSSLLASARRGGGPKRCSFWERSRRGASIRC